MHATTAAPGAGRSGSHRCVSRRRLPVDLLPREELKGDDAERPCVHHWVGGDGGVAGARRPDDFWRRVRESMRGRDGVGDGGGAVKVGEHPPVLLLEEDDVLRLHAAVDKAGVVDVLQVRRDVHQHLRTCMRLTRAVTRSAFFSAELVHP